MSTPKFTDIISAHKQRKEQENEQSAEATEAPPIPPPAPAKQPKASPTPAQEGRKVGRPAVGKRGNPDYTQVSVLLNKERYTQARIALLQAGGSKDMSDLVDELLTNWLKKRT